jgi:hypothetical protein
MSPPVRVRAGETLLVPVTAAHASGRLGFGALNESGQWVRTYELEGARTSQTLEFTAGEDGVLTLVLYSAVPQELSVRLHHGEINDIDATVNTRGIYGAGDIRVEGFRVYDAEDRETPMVPLGTRARFEIDYRIVRPDLREYAQVLLAFQRDGVTDVLREWGKEILFDYNDSQTGTLSLLLDPLPLAAGNYTIALLIGAEGYYDREQKLYFSINPEAYFVQAKAAEIEVTGSHSVFAGAGVVRSSPWTVTKTSVRPLSASAAE